MLNYMKSEWYRQRNNRGLQNTILVCLGLIILMVAVLAFFGRRPGFAYANAYFAFNGIFTSMSGIFPLTLVFAGFMENNSRNRQSPLKNSVAFGIPRSSIYLGKFLVQLLICTLVYLILPAVLVCLSWLFLEHSNEGEWYYLAHALIGGYPLCVFMLSIGFCFIFNIGNSISGILPILFIVYILPYLFRFLGMKYPIFSEAAEWCPASMLGLTFDNTGIHFYWDTPIRMLRCYLSGLGGALIFLCAGIFWLKKREIR